MGQSDVSGSERAALAVVPVLVVTAGALVLLAGMIQALSVLQIGGSIVVALFDLLFLGGPGGIFIYTGYRMPRSDITPRYYPRIIAWVGGGVVVMYGFILLRDLHPAVTAEWSVGTQGIALMLGSVGGLLIGIQETKAMRRTAELEARTDELEAQERRLKRQNEQLERFANVVSHDLRNPLNVAAGRLELAREERDSSNLRHIERAHDRMETLIEDLLALAREGDVVTDPEAVDLAALVERCWATVETADAAFVADVDITIHADGTRVEQLVENLLRNAIEHGGEDVVITVGTLSDGFYVEDTGPGIPEADRADVFETGYSTSDDGTGFGLSIVKQVVDGHDWTIRVTESAEGGARFEITGVDFVTE
jgi:signal transduction histidine kinase